MCARTANHGGWHDTTRGRLVSSELSAWKGSPAEAMEVLLEEGAVRALCICTDMLRLFTRACIGLLELHVYKDLHLVNFRRVFLPSEQGCVITYQVYKIGRTERLLHHNVWCLSHVWLRIDGLDLELSRLFLYNTAL